MDLDKVISEILEYLKLNPKDEYQLVIGSDSEGNKEIDVVTAIVIYRKGKGGRYFWTKIKAKNIHTLRQKIYKEVECSINCAKELLDKIKNFVKLENPSANLEIHIDVGENGPTKALIKEVVGMVLGYGFKAKTKPESFGASLVADRHI